MKKIIILFIMNIIWQVLKNRYRKEKAIYYLDLLISIFIILILIGIIYIWIIFQDIVKYGMLKSDLQLLGSLFILMCFYIVKVIRYLRKKKIEKIFLIISTIIELSVNLYFIL